MTKNFIEVGGTYKSKRGDYWECIGIKDDRAWLVLNGNHNYSALPFHLDGTPVHHQGMKEYQLLPPKPKIEKDKAYLWRDFEGVWGVVVVSDEEERGALYTHPEHEVALFVPKNMDYETLAKAIYALQEEIVG